MKVMVALSPAFPRRARRVLLPGFLLLLAAFLVPVVSSPAGAEPQLHLSTDTPLAAAEAPIALRLRADLEGEMRKARARIEVRGPGRPQTETGRPEEKAGSWPLAASLTKDLGTLKGRLDTVVTVSATNARSPGTYWVSAEIASSGGPALRAELWLGRLSSQQQQVDLALVFPLVLGVHRDPEGVFTDQSIQESVVPNADADGSIYSLLTLPERFPGWRATLAVEPLFFEQLDDLAGGYRERGRSGEVRQVGKNEEPAAHASQALATLKRVADVETIQVIPGPYAMPDTAALPRERSTDGLEQMQMGKSIVQSALGLNAAPEGAYPPGLDITADTLACFSRASIDYVPVSREVAADLADPSPSRVGAVRVRNTENDRLLLLFVDSDLRATLGGSWDPNLFFAVLASKMAAGERGPFVVAPADDYTLPPAAFIRGIGEILGRASWIRTSTLDDLVDRLEGTSAPVLLNRYAGYIEGFVSRAFLKGLEKARAYAADLEAATDSDRAPFNRLRLLLYQAQSRYWLVKGAEPRVANLGLAYVEAVSGLVQAEFDKVDVAGDKSVIFVGSQGEVPVAVVNRTGYPLKAEIRLSGDGVDLQGEDRRAVTLGPQENIYTFRVASGNGSARLNIQIVLGGTVVDEGSVSIRSLSLRSLLPWLVLGVAVTAGLVGILAKRRLGSTGSAPPAEI